MSVEPRCFYFGCWNEAGHHLIASGGRSAFHVIGRETYRVEHYGAEHRHVDGTLAPRRFKHTGELTWTGEHPKEACLRIESKTEEYPQGHYLCHVLDNGFTAVQWWDRCQGDTRGACNSTILLEGVHTAEEVLAAGRAAFPHVFENLERGGPPIPAHKPNEYWRPPENQGSITLVKVEKMSQPVPVPLPPPVPPPSEPPPAQGPIARTKAMTLQEQYKALCKEDGAIARSLVELCARTAHEANRVLCFALDDGSQEPWCTAPEWQAESVRMGVRSILEDDVSPDESHERWMANKTAEGWTFGEIKDAELKTHPCLAPYDQLPFAQRMKDTLFGTIVRAVATNWFEHPRSLRAAPGPESHGVRETDVNWMDWMSDGNWAP